MTTDIILFLTGIVVGAMNAIAGGGGLVGFPVLIAVGLPPLIADATNFVTVLPGQIASAFGYRKFIAKVPKIYLLLLIPCIIGAAIGSYLLRHISLKDFEHIVPFLILAAVVLFALQPLLHFHFIHHLRARRKSWWKLAAFAAALLIMTIYGGFFGVGMGFALLALIGFTNIHEIHTMNGLKNIVGITSVSVAIISIYSAHIIDWHYGLIMAGGSVIGGYFSSRLAQKVSSHYLRIVVIIIGLATVSYLAWRYH